jgi:hypothetical protein
MNFYQTKLPADPSVTLYIRQGPKTNSRYALAAHTNTPIKGKEDSLKPCQASLYLGYYETFAEALVELRKLL